MSQKKRVVVTGMGLVSCYGTDVEDFYENLLLGKSGVSPLTTFPCDDLPTRFGASIKNFNSEEFLDKKQARRVDPCIAYAVAAGKKAFQDSGLDAEKIDRTRAGILIGSGMGGMQVFYKNVEAFIDKGPSRVTPFFIPFIITNMPGALLAINLGFKGPNYSVSTACATSNYAIALAANHIRSGDADIMITGGVEAAIGHMTYAGFSSLKALSKNNDNMTGASRPWDKGRDGFVIGEGSGAVVLESLEHALKRGAPILAEYRGSAMTCDANHLTEPTPDGSDVARCIERALEDAKLSPRDINYVNAHATSTPVGDLCEIRALRKIFSPDLLSKMRINATKSLIGHALGGAGALEFIATVKAIQTGRLHPTINSTNLEEELAGINIVPGTYQEFPVEHALTNSFGFGGHNCVLAISKYRK